MNLAQINESYKLRDERLCFIPESFRSGVVTPSTASDLAAKPWPRGYSPTRTPLWRFPSSQVVVLSSKPVSVKVSKGETLFFAESENLSIFATGESRGEAIHTFCEHLVHFYVHYKRLDWDRVTGKAQKLKEIYEDLFEEARP